MPPSEFRVLRDQSRLPAHVRDRWPESLPWALVEPWRAQAWQNHGQTLERLNARGGLAPQELWCVAHGKGWRECPLDEVPAGAWLIALVAELGA